MTKPMILHFFKEVFSYRLLICAKTVITVTTQDGRAVPVSNLYGPRGSQTARTVNGAEMAAKFNQFKSYWKSYEIFSPLGDFLPKQNILICSLSGENLSHKD